MFALLLWAQLIPGPIEPKWENVVPLPYETHIQRLSDIELCEV